MSSNAEHFSHFGCNAFDDRVMRQHLPLDVYESLRRIRDDGYPWDPKVADAVAHAMKDWAIELGATHYIHWFSPLTGVGSGKHDSFIDGNIGRALLPIIGEVQPDDMAVVELSSFQLISMDQSPDIAVVTNVTPNHLDHHKDMQEYIDAKRNILLHQSHAARAVLGYENQVTREMAADVQGSYCWFTRLHEIDNGAFLRQEDDMLCMAQNGIVTPILRREEVKLRGLHNVENLLAASAAVWGLVPVEDIAAVARTFAGVEHRIEPVRMLDGVMWYNDSIASSPTRTIAGLRSFDQKIIIIAGGYDKHIPYEPLAPEILAHVKVLVLMGDTGPIIEKAVRECPGFAESGLIIEHAEDMAQAVELARRNAKPGDIVSLSPASASFDKYPNFEVRGRHFKDLVNSL